MKNKKLIMFDFDGVLIHTGDLLLRLQREANPHLPDDYFGAMSHGNFHENLERAIREGDYKVQPDWDEKYSQGILELGTHDVIRELITFLSRTYRLTIVSSSPSAYIEKVLEKENIRNCFDDILGSDVHTSKIVKIKSLLEKYAVAPSDTIFITDTSGDIKEGNACGVLSIGVTWGLHKRETLIECEPFAVVDTVPELEHAIEQFFSKSA